MWQIDEVYYQLFYDAFGNDHSNVYFWIYG